MVFGKQKKRPVSAPLSLISYLFLLIFPLAATAAEVDGIAAQVGSEVILRSEVVDELRRGRMDMSQFDRMREDLIDKRLILAAAAESKMTIQEWVVENRIREIVKRSFDGDRNKLMDILAKQKVSYPEWRQRMKDDMVVGAMRWQVVDKNVSASPAELRAEYAAHPERYQSAASVTVSVILLKPEDAAKREEVTNALKTGDFAEVARRYSADSRAAKGGVWKDVDPNASFRPEVCEAIAKMAKGSTSDWIELDGWSFLIRKDGETDASRLSFADAYDRIDAAVREEKAKKLYLDWMARLRAATFIKRF